MISTARIYISERSGFELPVRHEADAPLQLHIRHDYACGTAVELAFEELRKSGLQGVGRLRVFTDPE